MDSIGALELGFFYMKNFVFKKQTFSQTYTHKSDGCKDAQLASH